MLLYLKKYQMICWESKIRPLDGDTTFGPGGNKKRQSYLYRTATTTYRCCLPALAGFSGSWSYKTLPLQIYANCINFRNPVKNWGIILLIQTIEPRHAHQFIRSRTQRAIIDQDHIIVLRLHMIAF